jgi:hypothetical protein
MLELGLRLPLGLAHRNLGLNQRGRLLSRGRSDVRGLVERMCKRLESDHLVELGHRPIVVRELGAVADMRYVLFVKPGVLRFDWL